MIVVAWLPYAALGFSGAAAVLGLWAATIRLQRPSRWATFNAVASAAATACTAASMIGNGG